MVKNLSLIDTITFADVHEQYSEERKEIYEEIFLEKEFSTAERLILTGAPNQKEEKQRRELLVQYISEFNERDNTPVIQTTLSHQRELLEDERLDENDYRFEIMNPDSSIDELQKAREKIDPGEKTIIFTNDYHVPRVEKRANSILSEEWTDTRKSWKGTFKELFTDPEYGEPMNDYLVMGAELEENEFADSYQEKWISETIRTILPQKTKDIAKRYILDY